MDNVGGLNERNKKIIALGRYATLGVCHRFDFSSVHWYGSIAAGNGTAFCYYAGTTTAGLESANGNAHTADGNTRTANGDAHAANDYTSDDKPWSSVSDATDIDPWVFEHESAAAGWIGSV